MKICDEKKCTGCMACVNACPKKCISMQFDDIGELHPVINNLCVNCGKCISVCPINDVEKHKKKTLSCYASYSKTQRELSSSGGIASSLSKYFLENDGMVCGAIFDGSVYHVLSSDIEIIDKMRGSKYVHSNVKDCYKEIKKIISSKKCLFIGTPCQVAGLKNVVGDEDNLFCVDLICHGVPSPLFLESVLKQFTKVDSISFRAENDFDKRTINGKEDEKLERYMTAFLKEMSYRESCYQCPFAENNRVGDITLGDFWEIQNFDKANLGVSCVLINSEKGKQILDLIKDDLYLEERKVESAYIGNPNLCHPSRKHKNRDKFLCIIKNTGDFDGAVKKTMKKEMFKNWLKKFAIVKWLIKLKARRK